MPTITILQDDIRVEVSTTRIGPSIVIIRACVVLTYHGIEVVLQDQVTLNHVYPGDATLLEN